MIVKVTEKNKQDYQKLFDKASYILIANSKHADLLTGYNYGDDLLPLINSIEKETADEYNDFIETYYIQDINDYFVALHTLMTYVDTDEHLTNGGWKYFTMIPLPGEASYDKEPTIKVNANTRAITVPSELKNLAVVGDVISEIVFFEIDRFFDTMDFGAQDLQAVVEWKRNGEDGIISPIYIKELSLLPNKVLIGWPITRDITEEAGQIEFSLRFFYSKKDQSTSEDVITYSFSTLTARANIANTLNLEVSNEAAEGNNTHEFIYNRIRDIQSTSSSTSNVEKPQWDINIGDMVDEADKKIATLMTNAVELSGKNYYADLDKDDEVKCLVQASTNDGNRNILYHWDEQENNQWSSLNDNASWGSTQNNIQLNKVGVYRCQAKSYFGPLKYSISQSDTLHILPSPQPSVKPYSNNLDGLEYNSGYIYDDSSLNTKLTPLTIDDYNDKWCKDENGNNEKSQFTYKWLKIEESGSISVSSDMEYIPTEPGIYEGYVLATRNNDKPKESLNGTKYRVTENLIAPSIDDFSFAQKDETTGLGITDAVHHRGVLGETIVLDFKNYPFDKIIYQWKRRQRPENDFEDIDTIGATGIVENGGSIHFTPQKSGLYSLFITVLRNRQIFPSNASEESEPNYNMFADTLTSITHYSVNIAEF